MKPILQEFNDKYEFLSKEELAKQMLSQNSIEENSIEENSIDNNINILDRDKSMREEEEFDFELKGIFG